MLKQAEELPGMMRLATPEEVHDHTVDKTPMSSPSLSAASLLRRDEQDGWGATTGTQTSQPESGPRPVGRRRRDC